MVSFTVGLQFKQDTSAEVVKETMEYLIEVNKSMDMVVEFVASENLVGSGFTHGFTAIFKSEADLEAWEGHEKQNEIQERLEKVMQGVLPIVFADGYLCCGNNSHGAVAAAAASEHTHADGSACCGGKGHADGGKCCGGHGHKH